MTAPRDPIEAPATEPGRRFAQKSDNHSVECPYWSSFGAAPCSCDLRGTIAAIEAAARDEGRREAVRLREALLHEAARQYVEDDIANAIAGEYERLARHGRSSDPTEEEPNPDPGGDDAWWENER